LNARGAWINLFFEQEGRCFMLTPIRPSSYLRAALVAALATLGLTAAHHIYGGVLYASPWRVHGAFVAIAACLPLVLLARAHRRASGTTAGRLAGWAFAALTLLVPVLAVGLFEGVFNHVLKNVLFFAGAPESLLLRLYPPPAYELPDDVGFESTGVAQVVPAAFAAVATLRLVRDLARSSRRADAAV
jgi:hypothetical protein